MTRTYSRWLGIALVVLGLTGFILPGVFGAVRLPVDGLHNMIHLLSGIVLASLAYNDKGAEVGTAVKIGVQASGIVYTLMGLLGFTGGGTVLGLFPVTFVYNLIHLTIGVLALYAGFGGEAAKA